MRSALLAILALGVAAAAQAQVYCWNTKDGKRQCGDTPPPGAKTTAIHTPSAPAAPPPPAAKDASGKAPAKKGPLTPAEQEQEFRKRQMEAQKARDKDEQAQQQARAKQENCERARTALRALESGQRIASTDKSGERYYLDEQQIARETERAREVVQKECN